MRAPGTTSEEQLSRQAEWLRDSWLWLLDTVALPSCGVARPVALDVGAGPGIAAEVLRSRMNIVTLDLDRDLVSQARARGFDAVTGDALHLPFKDGAFDIVYCSFFLLWAKDPEAVVREMARVSKRWVLCLAEPDHEGRIDSPSSLDPLRDLIVDGLRKEGADPRMGRQLSEVFSKCGLESAVSVHPGAWSIDRLRTESSDEWAWISTTAGESPELLRLRSAWDQALAEGTLFTFNPIFYALGRKRQGSGSRQA